MARKYLRVAIGSILVMALARSESALALPGDDFSDDSIDGLLWSIGGNPDRGVGGGQWQFEHVETNGYLGARVWGPTSGNSHGAEAWVQTIFDYNDGQAHMINFQWGSDVNASHVDQYAIQITDGTIPDGTDLFWYGSSAGETDGAGWTNLYFRNGQLDQGPTDWSILIDPVTNTATLFDGPNLTGQILAQKVLPAAQAWYVRFILSDATSSGFPAGDNWLFLYDYRSDVTPLSIGNIDCNSNGLADECEIDCGTAGGGCDRPGCGMLSDCNSNGIPDSCDIDANEDITQIIDSTGDGASNGLSTAIGIAVDAAANIYLTGFGSDNAFKITPAGVIAEIIDSAGDGAGNSLNSPYFISVDAAGNIYVGGSGSNNVFKITPAGIITEIIDATGDGAGNVLNAPRGIAVDAAGNVYVAGVLSDNVFKITPAGVITEIIDATGDGAGNTLDSPFGVAVDAAGNIYVACEVTDNAFKITPGGVITEIIDATGDGAGNILDNPNGTAVDAAGNVYVTGQFSNNAFKITPAGVITEIIDATGDGVGGILANPVGIAVDDGGNVYVTGLVSDNAFKITPTGVIIEILDASGDGIGNHCDSPREIGVDSLGDVYVACAFSHNAFKIPRLASLDCNVNSIPDECELAGNDCNTNGIPDDCDIATGTAQDCDTNSVPDECESDFDGDGLIDECDPDIDNDGVPNGLDVCDRTPTTLPLHLVELDGSVLGDLDGDCDVDLIDYAIMQERHTGPNPL